MLPKIEQDLRRCVGLKKELDAADTELRDVARKIMLTGGVAVNHAHVSAVKTGRQQTIETINGIISEIHDTGCLVKDLDMGLIDFPTKYNGTEVYLCWRLGESGIEYWHGVDEGFRGRKLIDADFLAKHTT